MMNIESILKENSKATQVLDRLKPNSGFERLKAIKRTACTKATFHAS